MLQHHPMFVFFYIFRSCHCFTMVFLARRRTVISFELWFHLTKSNIHFDLVTSPR